MLRRMLLGTSLVCLLVLGTWARGGERPIGEAIRAAAAAARASVVDVVATGRAHGRPGQPFVIPAPEGKGQQRQWRWDFRLPPGMEMPEGMEDQLRQMPFMRRFDGQDFMGRRRSAGFIASVDGDRALIAAPQQAVGDAREATVRLADGRELKAKVLGTDRLTGLACLEVQGEKLAAARPAKADATQVGDWVVALGGPQSGGAITIGIVSAKHRPGPGALEPTQVLLTDALVPAGSSGGPVVNLDGHVVGMALPAAPQGNGGRQLAAVLPIATLRDTLDQLARGGKVARGWLGVHLDPRPPEGGAGVRIARPLPGQPAANAGLLDGDVILEFDGKKVPDVGAFRGMVAAKKPGDRAAVKVLRGGQEEILEITLGQQPGTLGPLAPREAEPKPDQPKAPAPAAAAGEQLLPGLTVQELTPDLATAFGFGGDKGLVVTAVADDSPAAKARPAPIQRGDLIKEIDRKPVTTLADAKAALEAARKANTKAIILLVRGKEGARYLVLDLPR
ncbi:MAG: PDZ domain-containing protein [Candidatus Brocadiae bacterium]|nr:PDZ domain-containing protein [Candidatus Brocadiia bacterium]